MNKRSLRTLKHALLGRFFTTIAHNSWKIYLLLNISAIVLTYFIVTSDFDWFYFRSVKSDRYLQPFLFPAVIIGVLLPFNIPIILYLIGRKRGNARTINTALALGQTGIIGWLISSLYKSFTGRLPPEFYHTASSIDISKHFNFGFMKEGIVYGWPSGHTTVAFAMASAVILLYPENGKLRYLVSAYAIYIGFGVSTSIHWFSDFIAGALIGIAVGITVGKRYWQRHLSNTEASIGERKGIIAKKSKPQCTPRFHLITPSAVSRHRN